MSKINIGIIGTGLTALEHMKVINKINDFVLYGITSKTNRRSNILKKKYNFNKIYKNYKEMIYDDKIDALIIVVSEESNFKILSEVIPTKKPFFTEKPVGLNIEENKKILKIIKSYKSINMVGFNRRYYSIFHKGLGIIKKNGGLIGVEVHGHERFWQKNKLDTKIKNNWHHLNSIHTIDLINFFGGEIHKKFVVSKKLKLKKNDNILSIFHFKSGKIGSYSSYWHSPGGWKVVLYGQEVTVIFQPLEKGIVQFKNSRIKIIEPLKYDKEFKPGFYKQMLAFRKLIMTSKLEWPSVDIANAYESSKLTNELAVI